MKDSDSHTTRAKDLICNAFLSLMKEKGFAKITVQELVKKARVNRSTFYLYYVDKYDLLEQLEDRWLKGLLDFESKPTYSLSIWNRSEIDEMSNTEQIVRYAYNNGDLFALLALDESTGTAFLNKQAERIRDLWEKMKFTEKLTVPKSYAVAAVVGMSNTLLIEWAKNGFYEPPEKFLDIFTIFIQNVLLSVFEK